ncbi:hypothetical protein VL07_13415 [Bacillus safensis]|nr:hypothetical protein VL07_13415 [Bacillus safensis]KML49761.1 hypothetical protein VL18_14925 [Bacillus safensis]KMN81022.1 hypothetical protein VK99_03410 [Bacillus safensis]
MKYFPFCRYYSRGDFKWNGTQLKVFRKKIEKLRNLENRNSDIAGTIAMIYTIPVFIYLMFSWAVIKDSFNKATVNYFKDLLILARDEKKNDVEIV